MEARLHRGGGRLAGRHVDRGSGSQLSSAARRLALRLLAEPKGTQRAARGHGFRGGAAGALDAGRCPDGTPPPSTHLGQSSSIRRQGRGHGSSSRARDPSGQLVAGGRSRRRGVERREPWVATGLASRARSRRRDPALRYFRGAGRCVERCPAETAARAGCRGDGAGDRSRRSANRCGGSGRAAPGDTVRADAEAWAAQPVPVPRSLPVDIRIRSRRLRNPAGRSGRRPLGARARPDRSPHRPVCRGVPRVQLGDVARRPRPARAERAPVRG